MRSTLRSGDRRPPRKPAPTDRDPFGEAAKKAAAQTAAAQTAAGRTAGADKADGADGPQRLQKVLAGAGIGSRRACEELIAAGRVTVDGRRAELGDRADPRTSVIHIDGERVVTDARLVYLALNKPRGIVSTMSDERGRAGISELLGASVAQRVFHVGRLDTDSEGLLLLTNDGDLAHRLTHPSHGVQKTYLAEVPGPLPRTVGRALLKGVELDDGPAKADAFRLVDSHARTALVEITLHEGRKHIVRRMLAEIGHPVIRLIRTAVGPVKLGDLKAGRWRHLSRDEVAMLFAAGEAFASGGATGPSAGESDED
jgi:23S rRNA pseudouridine2605 synthase